MSGLTTINIPDLGEVEEVEVLEAEEVEANR